MKQAPSGMISRRTALLGAALGVALPATIVAVSETRPRRQGWNVAKSGAKTAKTGAKNAATTVKNGAKIGATPAKTDANRDAA